MINGLSYFQLKKQLKGFGNVRRKSTLDKKNPDSGQPEVTSNEFMGQKLSTKRKQKAIVTLILITLFYIICYSPFSLMLIYKIWTREANIQNWINESEEQYINETINVINLHKLIYINGGVNSLIYILRTIKIRKFLCRR